MRLATEIMEGARISLAALLANKMRSALTTIGIVIGIVTVTLMSSAIEGINRAFKESVSLLGSDVLYVDRFGWFVDSYEDWMKVANRREITWAQFEAVLKQMTLAKAVTAISGTGRPVRYKSRKSDRVTIIGTTEQFMPISGLTVLEGRFM